MKSQYVHSRHPLRADIFGAELKLHTVIEQKGSLCRGFLFEGYGRALGSIGRGNLKGCDLSTGRRY